MKLYELTEGIRALLAASEDRGGELTDEELAKLDGLTGGLSEKVEAICKIVREDDSEIAARTAEMDRLRAGITSANNRQKRLKDYLQSCLVAAGQRKVETNLFKVWVQASPPSALCTVDPETLPDEFKRIKVEADSRAAIAVWKETGTAPPGFEVHQGEHLRIK